MGVDLYNCIFCREILHPYYFFQCENGECNDQYDFIMCTECRKTHKCRCEITDEEIDELQKFRKRIDELTDEVNYFYLK